MIVSGGASGMGRATATQLAARGATVVIADKDREAGPRVAESLGGRATFEPVELRSVEQIESLVEQTEKRFGRIDGLANVAGIYPWLDLLDTEPDEWQEIDDVNHRAVFFLSQAAAKAMIRAGRGGAIVHVASEAAFMAIEGQAPYTGTKGAVAALTRPMARELAQHRIRVNAVAPGHTLSDNVRLLTTPEELVQIEERFGAPFMSQDQLAETIVFLLSDGARGMTGTVLHVNLGVYMPH